MPIIGASGGVVGGGSTRRPVVGPAVTTKDQAAAARKKAAEDRARARLKLTLRGGGSSPIGGFFRNLAGDVSDVITGIPSMVQLAGRNVAAAPAQVLSTSGEAIRHATGQKVTGAKAAGRYVKRVVEEDKAAVEALKRDYIERYGPTVKAFGRGDIGGGFRKLGGAFYAHPGFVGLDAATVWSGAGAGVRAGSKLADVAGVGKPGGVLRQAHVKSIVTGPRVRQRETLIDEIPDVLALPTEVRRPPMSRNPLTRAVFQRPAAAAARAIHKKLADVTTGPLAPFGTKGRIDRIQRKTGRVEGLEREGRVALDTARDSAEYAADLRGLRSYVDKSLRSSPHESIALHYHQEGLLRQPGMSGVDAARRVADTWQTEIDRLAAAPGPKARTSGRQANVDALRTIIKDHPDLLDEATAPPELQRAIASSRRLGLVNEGFAQEAYGLTPVQIRARAELPSRVVHGGQRIVKDLRPEAAELSATSRRLMALSTRQDTAPARVARQAATATLRQTHKDLRAAQRTGSVPAVAAAREAVATAEKAYQAEAGSALSRIVGPAQAELTRIRSSRSATRATLAPRLGSGRYQVATKGKTPKRLEAEAAALETQAKELRAVWEQEFRKEAVAIRAEKGGRFYEQGGKEHNAAFEASAKRKRQQKAKGSGMPRFTRPNEGPGGVYESVVERFDVHGKGPSAEAVAAYQQGIELESRAAQIRNAIRPGFEEAFANPTEAARVMAPGSKGVNYRVRRSRAAQATSRPSIAGPEATTARGRALAERYFTPGEKPLTDAATAIRTATEREVGQVLGKAQKFREKAAQALARAKLTGDQASIRQASRAVTQASRDLRRAEAAHAQARSGYVGRPREIRAATRQVDLARRRYNRQKTMKTAAGRTMLTDPTVPGFLPDQLAVYKKHIPVDKLDRAGRREFRQQTGRFSPAQVHKTLGILIRSGDTVVDPRLLIQATREAHKVIGNRNSLKNLIMTAAYRDPATGLVLSKREAVLKAAADPERIALVDADAMERAFRQGATEMDIERFIFSGEQAVTSPGAAARGRNMIAMNRAAVEGWQEALSPARGGKVLEGYDRILTLWKTAILTLAPRWYVHNTVGNTLQFALMAGPRDISAITRAKAGHVDIRRAIQENAPNLEANFIQENMALGMSAQAARVAATSRYQAMTQAAFAFNNALEGVARRGAYLAAAKKAYRDEGVKMSLRPERLGGMSDAEVARMLREMPDELKAEVIRHAERFLGDYSKFTPMERAVLKRIFPFYSWIRVISRLAVNLPTRHPLTAQFLAVTSEMAAPVINPLDPFLPVYQRGGVHIGGKTLGSFSTNPFGTVAGFIDAVATGGGPNELLAGIASGAESPFIQILANQLTGINQFTGRPFTAPPGHGGSVAEFGRTPLRRDPSTGMPIDAPRPTPGWLQGALSMLPVEPMVRGGLSALAGPNRPYDTTGDVDLLRYLLGIGKDEVDLFSPPPHRPRGVVNPMFWSQLASYLGAPLQTINPDALASQVALREQDFREATLATARARARAAGRLRVAP